MRNKKVTAIVKGEEDISSVWFDSLQEGDTFFVQGEAHIVGVDAHYSGDASYDGYLLYDTDDNGWFPEDLDTAEDEMDISDKKVSAILKDEKKVSEVCFQCLQTGDIFFVNGRNLVAAEDAHYSGDASYNGYLIHDTTGEGYSAGDLDSGISLQPSINELIKDAEKRSIGPGTPPPSGGSKAKELPKKETIPER